MTLHRARIICRPFLASLCAVPLGLAGCTGLEPALVGAAISGAQSGVTLFSGAEVWAYEIAEFDAVLVAIRRTEEELGLRKLNEVSEPGRYWVYYRFGRSSKLVVEMKSQTEQVVSIKAEVADKDQQGMASLFLKRLFQRVNQTRPNL
ncbi:MAG: hypothetical protein ACIAQF_01745 [Phycisphaerales bacterium JB065]